jgi:hypothetical protein
MKKAVLLILIFSFAAGVLHAQSEEDTEREVSLGASPIKKPIAGFTVLTAEDARVSTDGKTTYVEDIYVYTGRKFKAVEARLKKIEAAAEELNSRVKRIDKRLTDMEKAVLVSKEASETAPEGPPQQEPPR